MRTPRSAWQVNIPEIPQNTVNFTFASNLPPGQFGFMFQWFSNRWNLWVTLPSGEVRQVGVYPGNIAWTGSADYYFKISTTLTAIGQNDLPMITMTVYQL